MEITILKTHQEHGAGWVHAGETRTVNDERAKDLIRNGLAQATPEKKNAAEPENKKAPEPSNKKAAEPSNKAAK
jgi:hypothetical protein